MSDPSSRPVNIGVMVNTGKFATDAWAEVATDAAFTNIVGQSTVSQFAASPQFPSYTAVIDGR